MNSSLWRWAVKNMAPVHFEAYSTVCMEIIKNMYMYLDGLDLTKFLLCINFINKTSMQIFDVRSARFLCEVKLESYHTASNLEIKIEEIQSIKHINIGIFSDIFSFYITTRKSTGISRLLVNKVLILVVVIYFLTVYTKLRPPIS